MSWTRPLLALTTIMLALTAAALARAQSGEQDSLRPAVPFEARLVKPTDANLRRTIEGRLNAMGFNHAVGSRSDDLLHDCESDVVPSRDSWRDYDRLGEDYAAAGDARRAIACYDKSLTLNPDNEAGFTRLVRLQNQEAVRQSSRYSPH